ncbi:TlpA disulfide reductase family protein [Falsirhodobacter sp. alg1]|uniref:TlpA family protein disulfide reductase n=1 Tax=Falsirhodobacter sp. alg1 TaxID=1472418 RepID=UPI0005EE125D|nr:TlpA disulfide reductase family protein [Falsirhodobacter sp. alg1]
MLRIGLCVVYTALALGANAAIADVPAAQSVQAGDMRKVAFQDPQPMPEGTLLTMDGAEVPTGDLAGQWTVVNFWATWCPPCRHEMPSLDKLQVERPDLKVVTIASGRNPLPKIRAFFDHADIGAVTSLRDPDQSLSRKAGVIGLPVTLILNPDGQVVGRLTGDADWSGPDALAFFDALGS